MKILHYTCVYAPAWKTGGPARSVSQICEGLAKLGHDVTVFTTNFGIADAEEIAANSVIRRNGVLVHYFPAHLTSMGVRSPRLESEVRVCIKEFDIAHITGIWQPTSIAACRAAEIAKVPYVISPRGALGPYSWTQKLWKKLPYWWFFERRNCRKASAVHYTTTMEANESLKFRLPSKAMVIPNSVGLDFWKRDEIAGRNWRRELGISSRTPLFLNAGRIHHKKGLDLLPASLAPLRSRQWAMVFVGHPEDRTKDHLIRSFARERLDSKVFFIDHLDPDHLRAAYSAANLFVLPSRHENFGNVVIEAMSCGCPVGISDKVGLSKDLELLREVKVLPRRVELWTDLFRSCMKSPLVVSEATIDFLHSRFGVERLSNSMQELYHEVLKTKTDNTI